MPWSSDLEVAGLTLSPGGALLHLAAHRDEYFGPINKGDRRQKAQQNQKGFVFLHLTDQLVLPLTTG